MHSPLLHRFHHRAPGLVDVRAVAELTVLHKVAQFGEVRVHFFGGCIPQRERLPAGRVGNVSAAIEREQFACDSCMLSFIHCCAYFVDGESQPGLDCIEQR